MRTLPVLLVLSVAVIGGLGFSTRLSAAAEELRRLPVQQDPDEYEEGRERAEIERDLASTLRERELLVSQQALEHFDFNKQITEASFALDAARAEWNAFDTHGMSATLAQSELNLTESADGLQDAREEMEQLAQMYGDNELADRTAEIVLRRAKRSIERAESGLKLEDAEFRHQTQMALPIEKLSLSHAVASAELELRLAELQYETMELEQRNALADLDAHLAELREELAEAKAAEAEAAK